MAATQESLDLLRSIDATMKRIERLLAANVAATASHAVAADSDLDSKYGDPKVPTNPRDWKGPSFKGRQFSECPAEFLDLLADTLEYFATKADEKDERTGSGKPVSDYKRKDASRARGWAARVRKGIAPGAQVNATQAKPLRAVPASWSNDVEQEGDQDDGEPFATEDSGEPVTADQIWGRR
jgi:hypothetical protein